ncbi:MAG: hypothetical protein WBE86_11410 [Candidatus Acidiferrales bacterium]
MMAQRNSGAFFGGAGLVWRRQRLVWWIFAVNFVLAFFSIHGVTPRIGSVLDHSLAAQRLVNGFDIGALGELAVQPGVSPLDVSPAAMAYSLVFFVFMLFVTGGILEVYRRDIRLTTSDFFEACGAFFWRFVRLVIFLLLCLIPIGILHHILRAIANHIGENAVSAMTGVWWRIAAGIVIVLLILILRLWFDMAEIHCVAQNERRVRRSLRMAWRVTFGNFGGLFGLFLGIGIIACIGFGFGLWLWMYVLPPTAITTAFFLGQLMILWWLGTRLWQRSAETLWYQRYLTRAADAAMPAPAHYPVVTPQAPPSPLPPPSATDAV